MMLDKKTDFLSLTDEELAGLTLKNPHAYTEIIRRYESRLLGYVRRISSVSVEDAEDILQEAFLDAYKNITRFDTSLKFSSWIYRIVHNKTISSYRKFKKQQNDVSLDDDLNYYHHFVAKMDIVADIDKKITSQEIHKLLNKLNERDREVLLLYFIEEKTYQEIGDILQAPVNTVATWIRRAKERFKKIVLNNKK